jgi:hypothetical protein
VTADEADLAELGQRTIAISAPEPRFPPVVATGAPILDPLRFHTL